MRNLFLCCAFLIFFANEVRAEIYFKPESISPLLTRQPILRSSVEYKREVSHILQLQKNIDQVELKKAIEEHVITVEMLVQNVMPQLTRADFPLLYKMLDSSNKTALGVSENAKIFWNTKRPYLEDKRIKALVEPHLNGSYPSSHTVSAQVLARILGLLFVEKREAFFVRAEEIAQHRVLLGMHYPHDLAAAKEVSLLVVGALMQTPHFLKDLERAKEEIALKIQN